MDQAIAEKDEIEIPNRNEKETGGIVEDQSNAASKRSRQWRQSKKHSASIKLVSDEEQDVQLFKTSKWPRSKSASIAVGVFPRSTWIIDGWADQQ